ncbi:MAG: PriCT-2 domain-containing protein [Pirellulales bacterium]|nr:PriCT-2 domain-containing protein [Pirellulales bacterium]
MTTTRKSKAEILGGKDKPQHVGIRDDKIPGELVKAKRWVAWKWILETRADGSLHWNKPPFDARTGAPASTTDPKTWSDFDTALRAVQSGRFDGLGFVLGVDENGIAYAGVDFDDCRDIESGSLIAWVLEKITWLNSYTEVSPSRTGCKVILRGRLPEHATKKHVNRNVEMYDSGRYFTITGWRLNGEPPDPLPDRTDILRQFHNELIAADRKPKDQRTTRTTGNTDDRETALSCLAALNPSRADDRDIWISVGMILHDIDESLLVAWDAWSCQSKKYVAGECAAKWAGFTEGRGLGIGSLIHWAKEDGWKPRRGKRSDAKKKDDKEASISIANYETIEVTNEDGSKQTVKVPLSMTEIIEEINQHTRDWPRRVDNVLFVDDPYHGLDWFDRRTTAGLFGWLRRRCKIDWTRGGAFVGQAELFAELERTSTKYEAIELLPHEPPVEGVYYRGDAPKPGDGTHFGWLLKRFRPETPIDRDLIQAAFMTVFWGGPVSCRPAFVITSDQGRGAGKTKLAEIIAYLAGGFIDVSAGEDIATLKQRFLSPEGQTKRVAILDNVKSLKLSWAELESLITTPTISGKRMYIGEGQRPNLITWAITLNGVSLATDMAQRSVIIKLVKGENAGGWYEENIRYIDEHRTEIIGDIIGALRSDRFEPASYTRWATWERDILARLPEPDEAQKVILERQEAANTEADEAEIIEDFFAGQLARLDYLPHKVQVRIPTAVAARWYGWAINEKVKTAAASKRLHQMASEKQLRQITADTSRTYGRGFVWTGRHADVVKDPILNDLTDRLAAKQDPTQDDT